MTKEMRTQINTPIVEVLNAIKLTPSFAISLREETTELKGSEYTIGWTTSGIELIGKKTPERIT
tara:strand:+ start:956 stop:1147 length:192 start_codon:yes stop_codon:yes gene_type:complete